MCPHTYLQWQVYALYIQVAMPVKRPFLMSCNNIIPLLKTLKNFILPWLVMNMHRILTTPIKTISVWNNAAGRSKGLRATQKLKGKKLFPVNFHRGGRWFSSAASQRQVWITRMASWERNQIESTNSGDTFTLLSYLFSRNLKENGELHCARPALKRQNSYHTRPVWSAGQVELCF